LTFNHQVEDSSPSGPTNSYSFNTWECRIKRVHHLKSGEGLAAPKVRYI